MSDKIIWVVWYKPDSSQVQGTSGFDWSYDWNISVHHMLTNLKAGPGFDLEMRRVLIPDGLSDDKVTELVEDMYE